jgi:adenylate cyclase
VILFAALLQIYLLVSFVVVALEDSDRYVEAAVVTVVAVLVSAYVTVFPGLGRIRLLEQWAAGREVVDREKTLDSTYTYAREAIVRALGSTAVCLAVLFVMVGVIAGATGSRLVQYGIVGAVFGAAVLVPGVHSFVEGALRPARVPSRVTPGSVMRCPARGRPLPRGATCPCSRSRSYSPWRARWWLPCSIGSATCRC